MQFKLHMALLNYFIQILSSDLARFIVRVQCSLMTGLNSEAFFQSQKLSKQ